MHLSKELENSKPSQSSCNVRLQPQSVRSLHQRRLEAQYHIAQNMKRYCEALASAMLNEGLPIVSIFSQLLQVKSRLLEVRW